MISAVRDGLPGPFPDVDAASGPAVDKSLIPEGVNGFLHRHGGDAEDPGQLGTGRQPLAGLELPAEDGGTDRCGDLDAGLPLIGRIERLHTPTLYLPRQINQMIDPPI